METFSRSSPISLSGVVAGGGSSFFSDDGIVTEPSSRAGSAAGSYQGEGFLSGDGGGGGGDAEIGFQRPDFGSEPLVGTVPAYDRHVFLCYKTPSVWPSRVEAPESDRLPRILSAAVAARKSDMVRRTCLTICEGEDGTNPSNGDVCIFPDMVRYRQLTHFDVDDFVEEVLVKDSVWLPGAVETLKGSFVFVCAHGSRDKRCGACGPVLVKKFKEEVYSRGLQDRVFISPCAHVRGHKYAGNVIIFRPTVDGVATSHWYGYVSPDDVLDLVEQHILRGEIVERLWRGQMGLSEEDQRKSQELRMKLQAIGADKRFLNPPAWLDEARGLGNGEIATAGAADNGQGGALNNFSQEDGSLRESGDKPEGRAQEGQKGKSVAGLEGRKLRTNNPDGVGNRQPGARKVCPMPTWYETWEREDTYAVLAVVAAVASVAFAYGCYRQLR